MLKKFFAILFLLYFFIFYFSSSISDLFRLDPVATAKEKLVFIEYFSSAGGISAAALLDILESAVKALEKKLDIEIEIKKATSYENAFDEFLKGSAAATSIWADQYIYLKEKNIKIVPFVTYSVDNSSTRDFCLYSQKGKTIDYDNLSNKIIAFDYNMPIEYYVTLRTFLIEKGIDKPLYEVFAGFFQIPNPNSAFYAIGMGQFDFYWEHSDYQTFLKFMSKSVYDKINMDNCFDVNFSRGTFVIREDKYLKAKDFKKIFWENWDEIKKLKAYKQYTATFKTLKVNIIPPPEELFENALPLYQKAKNKNWLKEGEFLMKKMKNIPSGQIYKYEKPKKSYDECKRECAKSKNMIQCMDKCMK